ncbi:MAG TPA: PDZ domain-containing protein [Propionibacteriaceae bacterium]|nr:PDZ domain-containing protein [Propionibacteriaceae bacterium]
MTRQTWTAFVSALFFVGLALLLVVIPVPFVSWSPGGARDTLGTMDNQPIINVQGIDTYPTSGRLDMTILSVTPVEARLSLPQALLAYWLPSRDALPREVVYDPGKSVEQVSTEDAELMETAQDDAVVAALRASGRVVIERPAVYSVTVGGPAHQRLRPGDLVTSVDGRPTPSEKAVRDAIQQRQVGETVVFTVIRDKQERPVKIITAESTTQSETPVVGITLGTGYDYQPEISFDFGQKIGGPSAGLVFALAIYDKITDGPLLAGRHVAGTGTITPEGQVGPIGALQQKIASAEEAGATDFLVPAANCGDLAGLRTDVNLIRVGTLRESITALETLNTPGSAGTLPRC